MHIYFLDKTNFYMICDMMQMSNWALKSHLETCHFGQLLCHIKTQTCRNNIKSQISCFCSSSWQYL